MFVWFDANTRVKKSRSTKWITSWCRWRPPDTSFTQPLLLLVLSFRETEMDQSESPFTQHVCNLSKEFPDLRWNKKAPSAKFIFLILSSLTFSLNWKFQTYFINIHFWQLKLSSPVRYEVYVVTSHSKTVRCEIWGICSHES